MSFGSIGEHKGFSEDLMLINKSVFLSLMSNQLRKNQLLKVWYAPDMVLLVLHGRFTVPDRQTDENENNASWNRDQAFRQWMRETLDDNVIFSIPSNLQESTLTTSVSETRRLTPFMKTKRSIWRPFPTWSMDVQKYEMFDLLHTFDYFQTFALIIFNMHSTIDISARGGNIFPEIYFVQSLAGGEIYASFSFCRRFQWWKIFINTSPKACYSQHSSGYIISLPVGEAKL